MKKIQMVLRIIVAFLMTATMPVKADITGSVHDFVSGPSAITGVTEICVTCHVPHRPIQNIPLWAHELSTATYSMYNTNTGYGSARSGATYDGTALGKSKLCLSCHDGTVAVAGTTYISDTSENWILYDDGSAVAAPTGGSNSSGLKGSHPIAVTLPTSSDGDWNSIADPTIVRLDTTENASGVVSCTTCHNPHNKTGTTHMLVKSNASSALCLTCHAK